MKRWLTNAIATSFGIGYLPEAPGTAGSAMGLLLGILFSHASAPARLIGLACGWLIGVLTSAAAERNMKTTDPSAVVVDEVWGMWAVIVCLPELLQHGWMIVTAFVTFRLCDIFKPPPLRYLARAPGGWGIMLDDLGAAAYTVLILHGVAKWLSG